MKKLNPRHLAIFLLLFLSCGDENNVLSTDDQHLGYPTTLFALSAEELRLLEAEFDSLNDNKISVTLDKYGLIGTHTSLVIETSNNKITDENQAIRAAEATLVRNSKFTNVSDASLLAVKRTRKVHDDNWEIHFKNQVYGDIEVIETEIGLRLHEWVYMIWGGHFFRDIIVPSQFLIDEEVAKDSLIGYEIIWYDFGGQQQVYVISSNSFCQAQSDTVIVPLEKDEALELRVAWQVPIANAISPLWYVYVDVMTGDIIKVVQLFVT